MKQLEITDKIVEKANSIVASQLSLPAGYRIKVFCLRPDKYYPGSRLEKTPEQLERETRGSDKGIVVAVGPAAWKGEHISDCGPWASQGQIVGYQNYEGKTEEEPKGSGNNYRLLNDEGVVLYFEENCDG